MRRFQLIWHVRDAKGITQHSEVIDMVTPAVSEFMRLVSREEEGICLLTLSELPLEVAE